MANQVIVTPNANGTVEFKRVNNAMEILQVILFSSCFQIDWNKAANENVFDVFSGDNHFILELREVDGPYTAQDLYDYLNSLVDCAGSGGGGGGDASAANQEATNDKLDAYFGKKVIGKIFDLETTVLGSWADYPLNFIDPPLTSIIFTAGTNKDILTGLTASNASDLCSILNDVQSYFLFSVIDATKLLINDGTISINELQSIEFKTSNVGDMTWDSFADSPDVEVSNVDTINENTKVIRELTKAGVDKLDTYLANKNIGKILDLNTSSADALTYPFLIDYIEINGTNITPSPAISQQVNNSKQLAGLLSIIQDKYLFTAIDANNLLVNNGSLALSEITDFKIFANSGAQAFTYSALADSEDIAVSAEQQNLEQLKSLQATTIKNKNEVLGALDSQLQLKKLGDTSPTIQVAASATVVTLRSANSLRKELKIVNNGTAVLYIAESAGASLTNWAWRLEPQEMAIIDTYSGIVTGIWDVANGFAQVTETV